MPRRPDDDTHFRGHDIAKIISNTGWRFPWSPADRRLLAQHASRYQMTTRGMVKLGTEDLLSLLRISHRTDDYKLAVLERAHSALIHLVIEKLAKSTDDTDAVLARVPVTDPVTGCEQFMLRWPRYTINWLREGWDGDMACPEEEFPEDLGLDFHLPLREDPPGRRADTPGPREQQTRTQAQTGPREQREQWRQRESIRTASVAVCVEQGGTSAVFVAPGSSIASIAPIVSPTDASVASDTSIAPVASVTAIASIASVAPAPVAPVASVATDPISLDASVRDTVINWLAEDRDAGSEAGRIPWADPRLPDDASTDQGTMLIDFSQDQDQDQVPARQGDAVSPDSGKGHQLTPVRTTPRPQQSLLDFQHPEQSLLERNSSFSVLSPIQFLNSPGFSDKQHGHAHTRSSSHEEPRNYAGNETQGGGTRRPSSVSIPVLTQWKMLKQALQTPRQGHPRAWPSGSESGLGGRLSTTAGPASKSIQGTAPEAPRPHPQSRVPPPERGSLSLADEAISYSMSIWRSRFEVAAATIDGDDTYAHEQRRAMEATAWRRNMASRRALEALERERRRGPAVFPAWGWFLRIPAERTEVSHVLEMVQEYM